MEAAEATEPFRDDREAFPNVDPPREASLIDEFLENDSFRAFCGAASSGDT